MLIPPSSRATPRDPGEPPQKSKVIINTPSSRATPRDPVEPPQRGQAVTHITLTKRNYSGANTINVQSLHTTEIQAVLGAATPGFLRFARYARYGRNDGKKTGHAFVSLLEMMCV